MDQKEIIGKIEERQQELYETLCDLIRIDSVNYGDHGNEKGIAEKLGKDFEEMGYCPEVYSPLSIPGFTEHRDYYPGRHLEDRFNVSVVIPGTSHEKRLHIAAHSDTEIIGDLAAWTVPPMEGIIKDGRIWGRGACDDKFGIAVMQFLIRLFAEEGIQLPYDLVFTAYCDEEQGGGNGTLAACLKYPGDDLINLDGEGLDIWSGASGGELLSAGFATKEPVDNCEVLLQAIELYREEMAAFRKRRHDELMQKPRFAKCDIPDTATRFQKILLGGELSLNRAAVGLCYYTTRTEEEIRAELSEIAERLIKKLDPLGILFEGFSPTTRFFRFAEAPEDNPAEKLLGDAIYEVTGLRKEGTGSCLSDQSLYLTYGSKNALAFGIGRDFGVYGGAHQPDEFVECKMFLDLAKILAIFLLNYR